MAHKLWALNKPFSQVEHILYLTSSNNLTITPIRQFEDNMANFLSLCDKADTTLIAFRRNKCISKCISKRHHRPPAVSFEREKKNRRMRA